MSCGENAQPQAKAQKKPDWVGKQYIDNPDKASDKASDCPKKAGVSRQKGQQVNEMNAWQNRSAMFGKMMLQQVQCLVNRAAANAMCGKIMLQQVQCPV